MKITYNGKTLTKEEAKSNIERAEVLTTDINGEKTVYFSFRYNGQPYSLEFKDGNIFICEVYGDKENVIKKISIEHLLSPCKCSHHKEDPEKVELKDNPTTDDCMEFLDKISL